MKLRWTLLLVAAWVVAPALAQEEAAEKPRAHERARLQRSTPEQARANSYEARIERIRRKLNLDESQREEFDRIAAEFLEQRPGDSDRQRQRELTDDLRTAREENDRERVRELQTELRRIRTRRPMSEFHDLIEPILNEEQLKTLGEIRARAAAQRSRGRGPLAQLERLREELNLNEEQARRYDELQAELEQEIAQTRGDPAEIGDLLQEIRKAAEEGDEARMKELRDQLPDTRGKSEQLVADFLKKAGSFLEPEQKETLERFQREMTRGRSRIDLRSCFAFVNRLDLDQEQRQALREIQREAQAAEREVRRDPAAREELLEQVQQQLRDMLTDEQVAEFDRWVDGQKSPRSRPEARGDRPRREQRNWRPGGKDTP